MRWGITRTTALIVLAGLVPVLNCNADAAEGEAKSLKAQKQECLEYSGVWTELGCVTGGQDPSLAASQSGRLSVPKARASEAHNHASTAQARALRDAQARADKAEAELQAQTAARIAAEQRTHDEAIARDAYNQALARGQIVEFGGHYYPAGDAVCPHYYRDFDNKLACVDDNSHIIGKRDEIPPQVIQNYRAQQEYAIAVRRQQIQAQAAQQQMAAQAHRDRETDQLSNQSMGFLQGVMSQPLPQVGPYGQPNNTITAYCNQLGSYVTSCRVK